MQLFARCDKCGVATLLYNGDEVAIPFGKLPELIAHAVDRHVCASTGTSE